MTFKEIKKTITKTKELSKIIKNHISHSFLPITLNASKTSERERQTDRQRVREKATGLKTPCNSPIIFPSKKKGKEKKEKIRHGRLPPINY